MKYRECEVAGAYVPPQLTDTVSFAPEGGFAGSGVEYGSPSKWTMGNEDWWNENA